MPHFSRANRLVSKRDFQAVFAKPHRVTRKYLLALCHHNALPYARLGIIVGKHLIKHSVARNQHRRIIRESFRHHQERVKGLDLVVIIRSQGHTPLAKKMLRDDVDNLWQVIASMLPSV